MAFGFNFAEYKGRIEMEIFLDSLDVKDKAKVFAYIYKLTELLEISPRISEKLSKHISEGIFELRVRLRKGASRSFYFYEENEMIIFTHGFIKKTRKTPSHEIEKAKRIRDYRRQINE